MDIKKKEAVNTPKKAVDYSEAEKREISRDYKIVAKQGAGGCSVVYDAWRVADGHHVAIKVLALPDGLEESEAELTKNRFYREARILSTLKNEHCVHCLEYGVFSGAPCVVLEFVEGQQLDSYLREFGALPFEYGVEIICQVLEALEEAHSLGIIHRDIKPANIMIIQDSDPPVVRLIDFGIASLLEGAVGELMKTKLGVIRGTPSYMAPELFTGTVGASPESDLYSVGLVLYEIITGCVGVAGSSLVQIAFKQAHEPLQIPQNIPECLARIIRKCCDKEITDRYHNARDVINDLREALPEAVKQRAKCEANYLQAIRDGGVSRPSFNRITGLGLSTTGLELSSVSGQFPAAITGVGMQPSLVQGAPANNKTMRFVIAGVIVAVLLIVGLGVLFLTKDNGGDSAELYKAKADAEAAAAVAEAKAAMMEEVARANEAKAAAEAARAAEAAEAARAAEAAQAAEAAKAAEAAAAAAAAAGNNADAAAPADSADSEVAKPVKRPSNKGSGSTKRPKQTTEEPPPVVVTPPPPNKKTGRGDPTSIPIDIF